MHYPRLAYFDPPDRSDPDWRSMIYGEIIPRAVALIEHRSRSEIEYGVSTLNYLLSPAISELISDRGSQSAIRVASPATFLRGSMAKISIIEQDSIPNATWPEYFAILALSLAGRAFEFLEIVADPDIRQIKYDPPRVSHNPDSAAQSMEALVIAETLVDFESRVAESTAATIELGKSEAAIRGHQRRRDLWESMVDFYLANPGLSKAEAIRRFFRSLPRKDQTVLCRTPDNIEQVVRTLRPKLKDL